MQQDHLALARAARAHDGVQESLRPLGRLHAEILELRAHVTHVQQGLELQTGEELACDLSNLGPIRDAGSSSNMQICMDCSERVTASSATPASRFA